MITYKLVDGGVVAMGEQEALDFLSSLPPSNFQSVPSYVTRAQALMALYNAGILGQLESLVANHPHPPLRIWFTNALYWHRDNPYIQALGPELNLTEEDVDQLFIAAATLSE